MKAKKLQKIATFFATVLDVRGLWVAVSEKNTHAGECYFYSNGFCHIIVPEDYGKRQKIVVIAHEMVHARQYHTGQLRNSECGEYFYWGDVRYRIPKHMSDEYFLAPWEQEARHMEAYLLHKWETR